MSPWADELLVLLADGPVVYDYCRLVGLLHRRHPDRPRPHVGELFAALRWLRLTRQIRVGRRNNATVIKRLLPESRPVEIACPATSGATDDPITAWFTADNNEVQ